MFRKQDDYAAFVRLMVEANERLPMRIAGYCLLENHFHLLLWPYGDGDLSRWMQWLLTSHVRRYHRHYGGSGHVWNRPMPCITPLVSTKLAWEAFLTCAA